MLEVCRLCVCVCVSPWAHSLVSKHSFLSAFTLVTAFWALRLTVWNAPAEKQRFIMQRVGLQPQDSEKGFGAWGKVTINLVKSTDESLSHRYNQRHFRPLFPQRNSCFLWHVLKFYFKNSQHLKAQCVCSPGLHSQYVFGFLNCIAVFLDVMLLPTLDPHTEGFSLTFSLPNHFAFFF